MIWNNYNYFVFDYLEVIYVISRMFFIWLLIVLMFFFLGNFNRIFDEVKNIFFNVIVVFKVYSNIKDYIDEVEKIVKEVKGLVYEVIKLVRNKERYVSRMEVYFWVSI